MNQDGILLIDKPSGMTSHDVVAKVRRHWQRKDVGHAGTLDPLATGLMVVLVGHGTKLSDFLLNGDKSYEAEVQLGISTDSDDITGEVIAQGSDFQGSEQELQEALSLLSGPLQLPVPAYSAIKVKGQRLYSKARDGQNFIPPSRPMDFKKVELLGWSSTRVRVALHCSKGSYVRSWGKALGQQLGIHSTISVLRRTNSSPYGVDRALDLEALLSSTPTQVYDSAAWVPLKQALPHWPSHKIEGFDEKLISNGQISRKLHRFLELEYGETQGLQGVKLMSRRSGDLVSLLSYTSPLTFKIRRVFHNQ